MQKQEIDRFLNISIIEDSDKVRQLLDEKNEVESKLRSALDIKLEMDARIQSLLKEKNEYLEVN